MNGRADLLTGSAGGKMEPMLDFLLVHKRTHNICWTKCLIMSTYRRRGTLDFTGCALLLPPTAGYALIQQHLFVC